MKRASAPSYDLFKTTVAVVLAVILILMLLRGCATNPVALAPGEVSLGAAATETTAPSVTPAVIPVSGATEAATSSPSPLPPTITPTSTPAAALTATPTPAEVQQPTPTPTSAPDLATPTPAPVQIGSCNTSVPSRLSVGQTARVIRRLNMRSEPTIDASILRTNSLNTQVEIIGGPVCTPVGNSAYLWWQIRLGDGTEGWSAETPLNEASYFLEPNP